MKILLSGYKGFMGREVIALAERGVRKATVVGGVDKNADGEESVPCATCFKNAVTDADCILDFSHPSATHELLAFATDRSLPLVVATTGHTKEQRAEIEAASRKIPLFFAPNYSLGVALLAESAHKIALALPKADIEIIEYHHNRKADAPSGTALGLFEALRSVRPTAEMNLNRQASGKRRPTEIGIHSVRMANLCAIHEVWFGTEGQTIMLRHEVHDRAVFAEGALAAAEYLIGQTAGLYTLKDLLRGGTAE